MKKKESNKSLMDIVITYIPALLYLAVVVPVLMVFSLSFYSDTIGAWQYTPYNIIMILLMIALNLLAITALFYVANIFMKTNMKRIAILGTVIAVIMIGITLYKMVVYNGVDPEVDSKLWELTRGEYVNFRGYTITFLAYFIISMFVNRIAYISVKNKGIKTSK